MTSPIGRSTLDPQIACDFLSVFGRMEYALKAAGFLVQEQGVVNPHWDRFAQAIDADLRRVAKNPGVAKAIGYLLGQPPKKQVLKGGRLDWQDDPPAPGLPEAQRVLVVIRRVRSNLFHVGKAGPKEVGGDRNELLVRHALTLLRACMPLHPDVRDAYQG